MTDAAAPEGRVEALRRHLGGDRVAWWITRPQHIRYLTGVLPLPDYPAALLVGREVAVALWPGEVPPGAPDWADHRAYDPWPPRGVTDPGGLAALTRDVAAEHGLRGRTILVDADCIALALADAVTAVPGGDTLAAVRRTKDDDEVATIRRNLAGNDAAFARIARDLRVGVTDFDVAAWALAELSWCAGAVVAYDGNIGLGPAGADFEAQPAGRTAEIGDLLFVDLYPIRDGYGGDSTRSFTVGRPDDWAAAAHERLVAALEHVERLLTPGVVAADLDRVCRQAAADADGVTYPHHTGHGLGLFGQERPYLIPGSTDVLEEGDVVAVEPGAYRPGRGGLRIEDVFLVTADGCERLNAAPRVLEVCG